MGGFNIGAFLQGGTQGYKFIKDMDAQEADTEHKKFKANREKVAAGREDAAFNIEDEVNKGTVEFVKKLKGQPDIAAPAPLPAGGVTPPTEGLPVVAQSQMPPVNTADVKAAPAPVAPAANGLTAPAGGQPATSAQNNIGFTNKNFIEVARYRSRAFAERGDIKNAMTEHSNMMTFAAKELQAGQAQRAEIGKVAITGILNGNYAALGKLYELFPDGKKLGSVTPGENGSVNVITVDVDGNKSKPMNFKSNQDLANAAMSMIDSDKALDNLNKLGEVQIKDAQQKAQQAHWEREDQNTKEKNAKDKSGTPEQMLSKTKDAAQKFGLLFGLGTDALGNIIIPPTFNPKEKAKYLDGIEKIQTLVDSGMPHYEAMNMVGKQMTKQQAVEKVNKPSKDSSSPAPYPKPWAK